MWNATTLGFFSAVQHRDDADRLIVRARVRADADRLIDWVETYHQSIHNALGAMGGRRDTDPRITDAHLIVRPRTADYPYGVDMARRDFAVFMAEQVEGINYPNFKNAVAAGDRGNPKDVPVNRRLQAYHHMWYAMQELEQHDPQLPADRQWGEDRPFDR